MSGPLPHERYSPYVSRLVEDLAAALGLPAPSGKPAKAKPAE
jgi:hypothetical protein